MASFDFRGTALDRTYHHIFVHSVPVLELLGELGLEGNLEWYPATSGYFYRGRVYRLTSPSDLLRFRPLRLASRLRAGLAVLRARRLTDWRPLDSHPACEWLREVFGDDVYCVMWEPLLRSKFGDAYDRISAAWFWYKLRQRGASKGRGERLGYLRGSFGRLAEALVGAIESSGGRVLLGEPARQVSWDEALGAGAESLAIVSAAGERRYDAIILTVAPEIILQLAPAIPQPYRGLLEHIDYTANLCMVLALDRPLTDIYWLNISDDRTPFGGIIEHTNLVSPARYDGCHIAYLTRYLPANDPLLESDDESLLRHYESFIEQVAPGFSREWVQEVHVFRSHYAAPLAVCGYGQRIPPLRTPVPGLYMASMAQIYPEDRGLDCGVVLGRKVASAVIAEHGKAQAAARAAQHPPEPMEGT